MAISQRDESYDGSVFTTTTKPNVFSWIDVTSSNGNSYRHHLLKENPELRKEFIKTIKPYFQEAHEDARRYLRELAGISLAPNEEGVKTDPAEGYPQRLGLNTLKGYFGETFVGWALENLPTFKVEGWQVPAYLFRFHTAELQQLEHIRQTKDKAKPRPGRTGDDLLAFQLDENWKIRKAVYCEAKCTASHSANEISDAHEKAGNATIQDLPRLIDVLRSRQDAAALQWIDALRQIWLEGWPFERSDLVSYICGQHPIDKHTWIPTECHHRSYKGNRRLDVIEAHLCEVEALIREIYEKEETVDAV